MMKTQLVSAFAERDGVKPANVADDLDRAVAQVLRALRNGETAKLPGIGTIQPGGTWTLRPDRNER